VPFIIKVIDSEEVNAFALPGGYLYVNTGLLKATEDEAELAGIMAHEIAHVAARHATRQMTRSQIFDLASLPLIAFGGGLVIAARETVGSLTTMKFCRNYEAEADYLGVEYLYRAGYDPRALIAFFERVKLDESQAPGAVSRAFSTHPETSDRIKKIQQEIARILPPRPVYIVSTSDFDEVRSRLVSGATNRSDRKTDHPVLRRRGIPPEDGTQDSDGSVLGQP
jgi:predicted Zn-dependent protease